LLETYAKEFLAIADYCMKKNEKKTLDYLIVDKEKVIDLLDHNKYDTATNKLKIWKGLQWIDTDDKKLTKRRYDKGSGTYKTCVYMKLKVYETLKGMQIK